MAKQKLSLEAFAQAGAPQPAATDEGPATPPAPDRPSRSHASVYLDKRVQKAIKEIALEYDRKAHDLYLEGIDLMLRQYGRPSIADLTKGGK